VESVTVCRQRLEALRRRVRTQVKALRLLKSAFAKEAKHLRRHDQVQRLRDLRSKIMQEVQHVQRMESDAAYAFAKGTFIAGLLKFSVGALGAAAAGRPEHPLWVGARLAQDDFERSEPYGTVLVAVGPGGIPEEVDVVPVSRWARESERSEAEIEAALKALGYVLVQPQTFYRVMEGLESKVVAGVPLALPVAAAKLLPKSADGGST
jgi:hypothetical protein